MLLFVAPEQEPAQSTAPLFTERCPAGFPSPAADYTEEELDPCACRTFAAVTAKWFFWWGTFSFSIRSKSWYAAEYLELE